MIYAVSIAAFLFGLLVAKRPCSGKVYQEDSIGFKTELCSQQPMPDSWYKIKYEEFKKRNELLIADLSNTKAALEWERRVVRPCDKCFAGLVEEFDKSMVKQSANQIIKTAEDLKKNL